MNRVKLYGFGLFVCALLAGVTGCAAPAEDESGLSDSEYVGTTDTFDGAGDGAGDSISSSQALYRGRTGGEQNGEEVSGPFPEPWRSAGPFPEPWKSLGTTGSGVGTSADPNHKP